MIARDTWETLAQAYAFLGNSLLAPMTQTSDIGASPDFWRAWPLLGDARLEKAIEACAVAVNAMQAEEQDVSLRISVEYTKLFVGPPSPAAKPWETFYRHEGVAVGFGQATFEMQDLLREAGLCVSNENNQYADHMGLELLYLSELCLRRARGDAEQGALRGACDAAPESDARLSAYIQKHPLHWIDALRGCVGQAYPGGYFDCLLDVASALLAWHEKQLAA